MDNILSKSTRSNKHAWKLKITTSIVLHLNSCCRCYVTVPYRSHIFLCQSW